MTAMHKRAIALEYQFAHEQELHFRAEARSNALIALWAAELMGRADGDAYARDLVSAAVIDPRAAFQRLRLDFDAAGVAVNDDEIHSKMSAILRDVAEQMRIAA